MAYRALAVCRRGGCGELADVTPAACEGDLGWCETHRAEVQRVRFRLAAGVKAGMSARRSTEPKERRR